MRQAPQRLLKQQKELRNHSLKRSAVIGGAGAVGMFAGQRMLQPVVGTIKEFAGFEEQMDAVAAIARLKKGSKDDKALRNLAADLGASTSYTQLEVGQAMEYMAMAGLDKKAITYQLVII